MTTLQKSPLPGQVKGTKQFAGNPGGISNIGVAPTDTQVLGPQLGIIQPSTVSGYNYNPLASLEHIRGPMQPPPLVSAALPDTNPQTARQHVRLARRWAR